MAHKLTIKNLNDFNNVICDIIYCSQMGICITYIPIAHVCVCVCELLFVFLSWLHHYSFRMRCAKPTCTRDQEFYPSHVNFKNNCRTKVCFVLTALNMILIIAI